MESRNGVQIVTVSGACCMPHLAQADAVLARTLQSALSDLGLEVKVRPVSLSAVLGGGGDLTDEERRQILALFQRYGARCAPAVLVNGQVRFAGKQPTKEQLLEALQAAAAPI